MEYSVSKLAKLAGVSPRTIRYYDQIGLLSPKEVNDSGYRVYGEEELDLLARTKTGVAHCPVSNMKLSSGIAKIPEMLKKGVPVGLAVDGSASNDGSNMLEEMRCAYLLHRLNSSNLAPDGYDILKIATRGSAQILGREKLGQIDVGMAADFFLINLNRIELVGAQFDPKSMLSTVGVKGAVDYTVVNGSVVVKEGRLVRVEEESLVMKANDAVTRYLNR